MFSRSTIHPLSRGIGVRIALEYSCPAAGSKLVHTISPRLGIYLFWTITIFLFQLVLPRAILALHRQDSLIENHIYSEGHQGHIPFAALY